MRKLLFALCLFADIALPQIVTSNGAVLLSNGHPVLTTAGVSGTLTLTPSTGATSVNITSVGTANWAVWGAAASVTPSDTMSGGSGTITLANPDTINSYGSSPRTISWTNGTPTGSGSLTAGVYDGTVGGTNWTITMPADTTLRTAYVYVEMFNATTTAFACSLSDASASPQSYTGFTAGASTVDGTVQISYKAASSAQTLTCTWKFSVGSGNIVVQGVAHT
jgi:hypothetical protein